MNITERVKAIAEYIIKTEGTISKAADRFGVSKCTVHLDLTQRLPKINEAQAKIVKVIIKHNKEMSHIRGGYATKRMWELKKAA